MLTDDDSDCLNGGGGHNKLVAGMSMLYNVRGYG